MIAELGGVRLLVDLPDHGLKRGAVGTVLMIHTSPSLAYEVEFMGRREGLLPGADRA